MSLLCRSAQAASSPYWCMAVSERVLSVEMFCFVLHLRSVLVGFDKGIYLSATATLVMYAGRDPCLSARRAMRHVESLVFELVIFGLSFSILQGQGAM